MLSTYVWKLTKSPLNELIVKFTFDAVNDVLTIYKESTGNAPVGVFRKG